MKPRNVRNFWIETTVDGKKTEIATGPKAKDGGFTMEIYQRDKGEITTAFTIIGDALDGSLKLQITGDHGVLHNKTTR